MQIILTEQQAQVLVNLIDLAVKSAGLQAAEAGAFFSRLIREAAAESNSETAPIAEPEVV